MNKKIYILPLLAAAALQFSACSNEDDSLFDQSAAERLEAGQKEYFSALCADGGKWVMEYFSNTEEPGYVFVMEFEGDKSVTISTDHKWIGNTFKQEKSLWDVIGDNGIVLSFNSYNTLFHVFSNPENIEGPDAPKNPATDKDVDEQGYGHNGDYEFMFLDNDGSNIRLLGKKRSIYAYMRKLASDTDPEAYLAAIKAKRTQFSSLIKFPNYVMIENATGALYDVSGMGSGVVSVVPLNSSNPFARTETKACVITTTGMRPISTFDFIRENDSHFEVPEFTWASDGSLVAPGVKIIAQYPGQSLVDKDRRISWYLDKDAMGQSMKAAHDAASALTGQGRDFRNIYLSYADNNGKNQFSTTIMAGTRTCRDFYDIEVSDDYQHVTLKWVAANKASSDFAATIPEYVAFRKMFEGEFEVRNAAVMDPATVTFTSKSDSGVSFIVNAR